MKLKAVALAVGVTLVSQAEARPPIAWIMMEPEIQIGVLTPVESLTKNGKIMAGYHTISILRPAGKPEMTFGVKYSVNCDNGLYVVTEVNFPDETVYFPKGHDLRPFDEPVLEKGADYACRLARAQEAAKKPKRLGLD